jgi:oligopeptidase B
VRTVFARRPKVRHHADHLDGRWVLRTNEDAPNFKLVAAPQRDSDVRRRWRTLIAGRDDAALESFALFKGGLAVQERVRADPRVRVWRRGRWVTLPAPPASTVTLHPQRDARAAWLRYGITSMVQPPATYDWHLQRGQAVLRKLQKVPTYDASRYRTQRLWVAARDGQRIPVTLAWREGKARQEGSAPLLLTGYGAYGMAYDAEFRSTRVSLMDRGFVVAIAHVRGGADLGQAWYEAGRLMQKKNTFNDFIDAAQALVQAKWADPQKLFASGGSAGGLLMGAVANEAPRLWRGMVLQVPFVDVVTTMLDETIPLTANEWTQWGDPREKAAYDYMLSYSPYDNLRAQDYPAMLVTTGLWDSQVQYFEPAKYVARLRARKTDRNPVLLAVNTSAGHGGASGRFAILDEVAREYAFLIDLAR